MNELRHFDLVTIGGGFAGLCTAVRSAELGLRTAVLEAGTDENYPCSSQWAGGIFHVSYHDVKLSPDQLLAAINRQTSGETDEELAAAIAADAGRTVDWLANQGAAFPRAAQSAGTASRWRRRACGWPGRIGRGVARTGSSANCGGGSKRDRVGFFLPPEQHRCAWSAVRLSGLPHARTARWWISVLLRLLSPMVGSPAMPSCSASISGHAPTGC